MVIRAILPVKRSPHYRSKGAYSCRPYLSIISELRASAPGSLETRRGSMYCFLRAAAGQSTPALFRKILPECSEARGIFLIHLPSAAFHSCGYKFAHEGKEQERCRPICDTAASYDGGAIRDGANRFRGWEKELPTSDRRTRRLHIPSASCALAV